MPASTHHTCRRHALTPPPPPHVSASAATCSRGTASNGRDLPWRKTDDPYHILVSEIMLQQTQVDRVLPKYQEWLGKYPSLEALAEAPARRCDARPGIRSATTSGRSACNRSRSKPSNTTADSCPPTTRRCCRSRASASTPPARSAASRSVSARRFSTPTSPACCFASSSARAIPKAHAMKRRLWALSEALCRTGTSSTSIRR